MTRLHPRLWIAGCAVQLVLGAATRAGAHEIGKTQMNARVQSDGAYLVDITVDPDALLIQMQLARDGSVPGAMTQDARDRQLAASGDAFLHGVVIAADGAALEPAFNYHTATDGEVSVPGAGLVRLAGRLPPATRTLTIRYDWAGGTFALVLHAPGGPARTFWIEPQSVSPPMALTAVRPPQGLSDVVMQYVALGVTHIVPRGVDHMLFVVGLCLLRLRWHAIVTQISAFTLAHSVSLALTASGVVALSPRVIEPAIALSIAYIAFENLMTSEVSRWRTLLVFGFGLLHGMGFASVLREVGLPPGQLLPALLSFNVGVEIGQLTVVAVVVLAVGHWSLTPDRYRRFILQPSSAAIALIGLYWTAARLL